MELIDFLRARLDEDQAAAEQMARYFPSPWEVIDRGYLVTIKAAEPDFRVVLQVEQERLPRLEQGWLSEYTEHVVRWDPARVLAEVEAKRALLVHYEAVMNPVLAKQTTTPDVWKGFGNGVTLAAKLAALPYRNHPDYDAARWAP